MSIFSRLFGESKKAPTEKRCGEICEEAAEETRKVMQPVDEIALAIVKAAALAQTRSCTLRKRKHKAKIFAVPRKWLCFISQSISRGPSRCRLRTVSLKGRNWNALPAYLIHISLQQR